MGRAGLLPEGLVSKRDRPVGSASSSAESSSSVSSAFSLRITHGDACEACCELGEGEVAYCMACARAKWEDPVRKRTGRKKRASVPFARDEHGFLLG